LAGPSARPVDNDPFGRISRTLEETPSSIFFELLEALNSPQDTEVGESTQLEAIYIARLCFLEQLLPKQETKNNWLALFLPLLTPIETLATAFSALVLRFQFLSATSRADSHPSPSSWI
jgi:hypothetical protein